MKSRFKFCVFLLLMTACSQQSQSKVVSTSNPIGCNGDPVAMSHIMSKEEILEFKRQALLGSDKAANKVAGYYSDTRNYSESLHWLNISAENGSVEAMVFLADSLNNSNIPEDILRAKFWMERAGRGGAKQAGHLMQKIESHITQTRP
jgi:hypothetical protein